jgi:hypothetical protein
MAIRLLAPSGLSGGDSGGDERIQESAASLGKRLHTDGKETSSPHIGQPAASKDQDRSGLSFVRQSGLSAHGGVVFVDVSFHSGSPQHGLARNAAR